MALGLLRPVPLQPGGARPRGRAQGGGGLFGGGGRVFAAAVVPACLRQRWGPGVLGNGGAGRSQRRWGLGGLGGGGGGAVSAALAAGCSGLRWGLGAPVGGGDGVLSVAVGRGVRGGGAGRCGLGGGGEGAQGGGEQNVQNSEIWLPAGHALSPHVLLQPATRLQCVLHLHWACNLCHERFCTLFSVIYLNVVIVHVSIVHSTTNCSMDRQAQTFMYSKTEIERTPPPPHYTGPRPQNQCRKAYTVQCQQGGGLCKVSALCVCVACTMQAVQCMGFGFLRIGLRSVCV